ncbi:DJ-1/PfpI family protein [Pedobacter sp.]|uniref:DJ-1/PfpI family protein n=1 Tax=Pedobacter sp. TaxID=1411316 RepID=UPI003BAD04CA
MDGSESSKPKKMLLGMVLFDGFQLLDVFGPLDVFGFLDDRVEIILIGEKGSEAKSSAGPVVKLDYSFSNVPDLDILMIPGGAGTRREVFNQLLLNRLKSLAEVTAHVATICTGSAMLAKTGILDGRKATTNKRAYQWATSQSDRVMWIPEARWVEDGKFFSSSGVSAGIDMAYALVSKLFGNDLAASIALRAEYEWKNEPDNDPFSKPRI